MEHWFAFRAYNAQTLYGFGTEQEADKYQRRLNGGRSVNFYGYQNLSFHRLEQDSSDLINELNRPDNSLGFNLGEEISELISDQGDWD
jgi:hypothetical protein